MANPKAPESTTPFSFRTGSRSGVRATDWYASTTMASSASSAENFFFSHSSALVETSRRTVRIVPSMGLRTAWKATLTARRKAKAMLADVIGSSAETRPSATPRRICEVMTPELPRAPIREPCVMAPAMASMSASAGRAESSLVTEASVSDMLVPVSPSGTGKTLSLLISSALSETAAAAIGKQVRMVFAIMGI